jgi:hypothetical protein
MIDQARYTLADAAAAIGVSTRTLRRRLKDGELSGQKQRRGKQDVWTIDGAELARYAESTGQALTLAADNSGQHGADAAVVTMTDQGTTPADDGQIAALRAELDYTRRTLADVSRDRDYLREILANVTKALPPATPPPAPPLSTPVPWWRRPLFGGRRRQ